MTLKIFEESGMTGKTWSYFIKKGLGEIDYKQPNLIEILKPVIFEFKGNIFLRWYGDKEKWLQRNFPLTINSDLLRAKVLQDFEEAEIFYIGNLGDSRDVEVKEDKKRLLYCNQLKPDNIVIKGEFSQIYFVFGVESIKSDDGIVKPTFYVNPNKVKFRTGKK